MAVDPNIKKKADDIRNKIYGKEVRESLASGLEAMSSDVVENTGRQDNVESQFQDVIENTTDKDVISAPEIIAARNGESNLKARLDKENQEVTAQLDQIAYNVKAEGAIGDGVTDDTIAIQRVFDKLEDGDIVYFPNGKYRTTETLVITKDIKLEMAGTIVGDHSDLILLVKSDSPQGNFGTRGNNLNLEISIERMSGKGYQDKDTSVGVEIWNAYYGTFYLKSILRNSIGIRLVGDQYGSSYAGFSYCKFLIGLISSTYTNILAECYGSEGYFTQNQFYSGSLSSGISEHSEKTHIALLNHGTSVLNENTFFGLSLEGHATVGVKIRNGSGNRFISLRYEMPKAVNLFDIDGLFNEFINSQYLSAHVRSGKFIDNPTRHNGFTLMTFVDFLVGHVEYYDGVFYIKPNKNHESFDVSNFPGINIPDSWENVVVLNGGMGDLYLNSNVNNVTNNTINIKAKIIQHVYLNEDITNAPFNNISFTSLPNHSTRFSLTFRSNAVGKKIVESEGVTVIDRTGNNSVIPADIVIVELFYHFGKNILYITNMI